jgi:hypothetical protein
VQSNKDWKIESDNLNVTLYQRFVYTRGVKKGSDGWREAGYYSTIKSAYNALIEMDIKGTGLKDLETVLDRIEELKRSLNIPLAIN